MGTSREGQGADRFVHLALAAILPLALYALSYGAVLRVDDEHILAARAQSLALWGELEQPQVYGNLRVRQLAAMGDQATMIEPAQTVLAAGLYRLARAWGVGGLQALFLLNPLATALTAGLIFATVLALGYELGTAWWVSLLFSVGSMAWPYATTLYRDPLAMAFGALAFAGWALAVRRRGGARLAGAGLTALGVAGGVLTKNSMASLLPALGATAAVLAVRDLGRGRRLRWALVLAAGLAGVGLLVALAPAEGPLARFSASYYRFLAGHFTASLRPEVVSQAAGPFVSPAKSIFLFSPPLILSLFGAVAAWKARWRFALPALTFGALLALSQALFYRDLWAGAFGWGLRFMLPVLPAWMPLAAPAVARLRRSGRWGRGGMAGLLALSAAVQAGGAWIPWSNAYREWARGGLDPFGAFAPWEPRLLAPAAHLRSLFRFDQWDTAWARLLRAGQPDGWLIPLGAVAVAAAAVALARGGRRWGRGPRRAAAGLVAAFAVALPFYPGLWLVRADPQVGGGIPAYVRALSAVEAGLEPGDQVVLDSYGTTLWTAWMNNWDSAVSWYALPFEIPGSSGAEVAAGQPPADITLELFSSLPRSRLWYVATSEAPDFGLGREVAWLSSRYPLLASERFEGEVVVEVRLYDLGGAGGGSSGG